MTIGPGRALADAIRQAALELPTVHARRVADAIATHPAASPAARAAASAAVPVPSVRVNARRILDAWSAEPGSDGAAIALALVAAADAVAQLRASQSVDVVWTGPATPEVPVRPTQDVLCEVIRSASGCLILVSFAAYRIPVIADEIATTARRGVDVRMVLEGAEVAGGTLRVAAADAFRALRGLVSFYEWPLDQRPAVAAGRASMHAKAAIADEHTALTTSANLTGHAIAANMELGLLVRGGPVPVRLARHFRQLMVDEVLRQKEIE